MKAPVPPTRPPGARALDPTADARHLLAAIVESSDDAILSKDLEGNITSWNAGAQRLYGYSPAEVIGRPITLLIPPERQAEEREILERIRQGLRLEHYETVRQRKDGARVDVSLTISPITDAEGRVIGASKIARDITGRKAAENALRLSEERFRLLADNVPAGIFLSDQSGRCVFVNSFWCELAGLSAEEARGAGWARAVHPEDRQAVLDGWHAAVRSGESSTAEFRFLRPDGQVVWVHGNAVQYRDGARFEGYLGSCVDVTQRKLAEQQAAFLHELSDRLDEATTPEDVMAAAAAGVGEQLGADRCLFFEVAEPADRGVVLHSWTRPGLPPAGGEYPFTGLGRLLTRPRIQVTDVREHQATKAAASGLVSAGIRSFATATIRQAGRWRLSMAVTKRRAQQWQPTHLEVIEQVLARAWSLVERSRALAALRESEQLYRAIGESIQYGIWVCDAEGRNLYASDSFLQLVGMTQAQCSEFGWGEVLHPDDAEATLAAWRECSRTGTTWEREHRFRGVDGRWHPVLARGVPIRDPAGRILRWVGINLDISRIKHAEEVARNRLHILERLNAVGPQLVAEHDLQKLLQLVTDTGREVSGAVLGAFIYNVVDGQGEARSLRAVSGASREPFAGSAPPRATRLFGPGLHPEAPVRVADVRADPRWKGPPPPFGPPDSHPPVRSYLAVPVVSRSGVVLGGLFFGHPEPAVFTSESEAIIVALAAQAAIAIDNAKLYSALQAELDEQRRAETLLRESERRWRQLAEAMPNLVWSCQGNGLHDFMSPQWTRYTGKTEVELLGDGWAEVVHPDDLAGVAAKWEVALAEGSPYDNEVRIRTAEGEYRWFKIRAVPVRDESGQVVRWYGSNTDVEDLRRAERAVRESEQQLRLVADHAPIYLAQIGPEHRFKFVNQPYADRYGRPREDIIGRHVGDVTGPAAYEVFRPHLERALQGVRVEFEQEIPYEALGRTWVHVIYQPERGADGRVVGLIAVIIDVSARKRTEQELERARDEALAASRAKDDFLATLSHELRTPLSPVLLLASDAACNPNLPREIRENFELIRNNISLEARLIDDLLDLTRITRGKMTFERQLVDLHEVIRDALANLSREVEGKRLGLVVSLAAEQTRVQGDPVRLQQVFWNILKNAVKFTDTEGRIQVGTRNDAGLILVQVADTGLGLTADELPRVFDAFTQGDHASGGPRRFGGLGLGLAISRRLVELHGGRIYAESPGRNCGSAFTVELPLAPAVTDRRRSRPPTSAAGAETGAQGDAPRLLLVEDHPATRETLDRLLTRRHYAVTAVGTAAEARLQMAGQKFDVFISDVGLPDGDGYDLMAEFRRVHPDLRGIAVSGYGMEDDLQRSQAAGFAVHLVKPVSISALEEAVARLLATPAR